MKKARLKSALDCFAENYRQKTRETVQHFFCPFLHQDKETELCRGHILPHAVDGLCRKTVPQRKDIDGFYGRVAEADFVDLLKCQSLPNSGGSAEGDYSPKINPTYVVGERVIKLYRVPKNHPVVYGKCRLHLTDELDQSMTDFLVDCAPEEFRDLDHTRAGLVYEKDFRLSVVISLMKGAYLTLFSSLMYDWALTAGGVDIGYGLLGEFYREAANQSKALQKQTAISHFHPFRNAVRPILGNFPFRGTLEDNVMHVWFGIDGLPVGCLVYLRYHEFVNAVLMPAYTTPDGAATYWNFLNNQNERLMVQLAHYDFEQKRFGILRESLEIRWPKLEQDYALN